MFEDRKEVNTMDERKFLESLKRQIEHQLGSLGAPKREWGRIMLTLLAEVDRRGPVTRNDVLEIGEDLGLDRHGLGGYYQRLLTKKGPVTLTDNGKKRLESLRKRGIQELPLPVLA
jgi:hypothetical protein